METTGEIFQRIIQIVAIVAVGGLLLFPVLAFPFWVWEKLENRKRFADVDALLDAQWKERVAALDLEFEELRRTLASTALSPLERELAEGKMAKLRLRYHDEHYLEPDRRDVLSFLDRRHEGDTRGPVADW